MNKICILDGKTLGEDMNLSQFERFGELYVYPTTKPEQVACRIKNCDIIVSNKVILNQSNLSYAPNVKLICVTATGTNNVDLDYARKRNIAVTNVAGYSTNSVVQHTFAMLFYLLEHLNYYDKYVKSKQYIKSDTFTHIEKPFWELRGKIWGIIGLGTIGCSVAETAKAFGCNIVYYSTSGKNNNSKYKRVELDELLKISSIVSIHAPLNDKTKNLITYEHLKIMKKEAILLNLGRGGIVNERDLAKALDKDLIGGAAVDVLSHEPIEENNSLLNINNPEKLLITPHIAWASYEARKKLVDGVLMNIESFLNGQIRNRVD